MVDFRESDKKIWKTYNVLYSQMNIFKAQFFTYKERNITTKRVISVWFIQFSTYFYHICMYIYIYIYVCVCVCVRACVYMCVYIYVYIYRYMYVSEYLCGCAWVYTYIYVYIYISWPTVVEGHPKAPFSIATTPRCILGPYSFSWIFPFPLDPYLLMLSVKQESINYHFLSLWCDPTWDWTLVSWAINEYICINIYIYIYSCIYIYVYMRICTHMCTHVSKYVLIYARVYI